MKPAFYCPQCLRGIPDDCLNCWECGVEGVKRRTPTPSNPGPPEPPTDPGTPPARRWNLTAALLPLLVVAGVLAYRGPTHAERLTIQTEPAGAVVRVGNRTLGVTPLQLEGDAGRYWVTIRLDDHEAVDAQVIIPQGGKAVANLLLKPLLRRKPGRKGKDRSSSLRIADIQTSAQVQVVASAVLEL